MNILIVEDEVLGALFIEEVLKKYGCLHVKVCDNALDAIAHTKEHRVDLVFMDINLEGAMDGIQCAHTLLKFCEARFIYISSYHDNDTLLLAINSHTQGYLVKPMYEHHIYSSLLIAQAHIEAYQTAKRKVIRFESIYRFECEDNQLYRDEIHQELSQKELQLLKLLLLDTTDSMSSEHLALKLYNGEDMDSATIRNLIRRLRQKLPDVIHTIHGVGYCIHNKHIHYA